MSKRSALIILDGWGHGKKDDTDMVHQAHTPFVDSLYQRYPSARLRTDGENVGLPEGQMGNSEVGHINLGAGRIVHQELVRINKSIEDGSLAKNPTLQEALSYARDNNKNVHLMGLVSKGGVHSHQRHLHALCDIATQKGLEHVFVHAFTDGRDTDPHNGINNIRDLLEHIEGSPVELASIIGRYYAMDRDKRWERIKKAYDLLTRGKGKPAADLLRAVQDLYEDGISDEFLEPIVHSDPTGRPLGKVREGDVVICFNFRTDRCRQITEALTQQSFPEQGMEAMDLHYVTMTNYDDSFEGVRVIFHEQDLTNTMGEVLARAGKTQLRIAETEKYPHVTYFFNGGREKEFEGERRIMIDSPKVATYDLKPEMSAYEVTEAVVADMEDNTPDFICLNFANPDMVGHTGVPDAIRKAVETVDSCTREVVEKAREMDYAILIIADHGNADFIRNADGSANTAHTVNEVPAILLDDEDHSLQNGILADVAPTLLELMEVKRPQEMTGKPLMGVREGV